MRKKMIGNIIEFQNMNYSGVITDETLTGLVVDAFTDITGVLDGKSQGIFGLSEGSTHGKVDSKRIYKVECYENWDKDKKVIQYKNIYDWQLLKIITYANNHDRNQDKI